MKLKNKFVAGFLTVSSLVALLGIVNIRTRQDVNSKFNKIIEKTTPELIALEQVKVASLRMMTEASSYALIQAESQQSVISSNNKNEEEEEKEEFEEAYKELEQWLSQIKVLSDTPERKNVYEKLTQGKQKLYQTGQELINLKQKGIKGNDIILKREEFEEAEEEFLEVIQQAIKNNLEALKDENQNANISANYSIAINLIAIIAVIVLSLILGLILAEKITKPIIQLKDAATKIGQGDFDTRVDINTKDELRVLADTFNHMVGQLQETTVSRSYLDNIIKSLSDGLIVFNKNIVIESFNDAALSLSGYQANELVNQPASKLLNQYNALGISVTDPSNSSIFQGRRETTLLTKDGKQIPVSVAASILENAMGKIEGIVCLVQDISARRQAEAALRRQALMFETIYDAVILTNLEGQIIDWNPAAERIFGYHKTEVLGKSAGLIYHPEVATELVQEMLHSLIQEERWATEIEFVREDGTQGVCETVAVPLWDENGHIVATMGVHRDITDRKRYENQLVEAREAALDAARTKAQFLANMSHEIRTPMNGVLGMSELLLTTELNPRQLDFVRTLQVSGEHLLTVINDVLDFSKLEAGEMRLDRDEFNLNLCLEEVLDLCNSQAAAKDLELGLLIDSEVPRELIGDAGRLRQILTNLVGNAIKFTHTGEVAIKVSVNRLSVATPAKTVQDASTQSKQEHPIQLRFAVKDTGIGIAPEDQQKLFKSFSQVDTSSTRKYGGTGLGLAICKQLVEMMDGEIGVDSRQGVGSTFWFTASFGKVATDLSQTVAIDLGTQSVDRVPSKGYVSLEALTGKRVLVVDDRPINRQIVQQQLTARGMEVDEAENGIDALNVLAAAAEAGKPYDVVLIDMKMPRIDGSTLGRLILSEPDWAHPKLVLMTSMHAGDSAQPLLKSGFSDYLVKPVKESRLLQSLLKVLVPEQLLPAVSELSNDEPSTPETDQQKTLKILIVEDTPINLKLVQHQVRLLGHEWDAVENGKAALDKLAQCNYDIVLMDCQMPVMDGYEATKALRKREGAKRHTVIVGMTAYAMQGDREKCLAIGMDDYLSKPVMVKDLKKVLQRWSYGLEGKSEAKRSKVPGETSMIPPVIILDSSADLIDWSRLEEIAGGDPSFQLEMVQEFIKNAQTFLAEAKLALAAKDYVTLANKAHQIKGGSASVAVQSISDVASQLHEQAKANNLESAHQLVAQLEQMLEQLKAFRNVT
jgi:PAS domain S-box-containing protein